jgi:hypothetical protein
MFKQLILLIFLLCGNLVVSQNVGIGTNNPHLSAKLEIQSPDQGLLLPRSDTALVNSMGVPATGLIIYQSTDDHFYYFNSRMWVKLTTVSGAFGRYGTTVRQNQNIDDDDFIFGKEVLPQNGEMVWDNLIFFDQDIGAFRGGIITNSADWSPDHLGSASFSFGNTVNASGQSAIALGNSSFASGDYSIALGRGIITPSGYETGFGRYNARYTPLSTGGWNENDRLLTIGNGTVLSPSNALTMLKNGNIGIGTENPLSRVSINGDGGIDKVVAAYSDELDGSAIYGHATADEYGTYNYGGYFESAGENGSGVFGIATKSGFAFASGGYFESASDFGSGITGVSNGINGVGVYGMALQLGDHYTKGGYFTSQADNGFGVYAVAPGPYGRALYGFSSNSGDYKNYGAYLEAAGKNAIAVYGEAQAVGEATNIGAKFLAKGMGGKGVWGIADAENGILNYGGYFTAAGSQGIGVYGSATNSIDGANIGGKFNANGTYGKGVYTEASGQGGYGLYAISSGEGGTGIHTEVSDPDATALFASTTSATGETYAVYGHSNSQTGYAGFFDGRGHFREDLGIGSGALNPDARLDIDGQIKIRGGSPEAGKILTSDASGLATWEPPKSRSSIGTTSATVYMDQNNMFEPHVNDCNGTSNIFIELFHGADVGFCIEIEERPADNWTEAVATCMQAGMRLPEPWEWQTACDRNSLLSLGLNDMENNEEWASNFPIPMYHSTYRSLGVVIFESCNVSGWRPVSSDNALRPSYNFRCVR